MLKNFLLSICISTKLRKSFSQIFVSKLSYDKIEIEVPNEVHNEFNDLILKPYQKFKLYIQS